MTWVTRITQPGFDVFTDTDPDHYSLLTDNTNILIKEFVRGSASINGSGTIHTIAHNLGYIPFFLVYVLDPTVSAWELVQWGVISASVPAYAAAVDTNNLYIINNDSLATTFKWFIFYDYVISGSPPAFTNTGMELALSQPGFNVLTDTNANDYIFHSNLNTFKILKEANVTINYTSNGVYSFNHNAPNSNPASHFIFVKFPDGSTTFLPGWSVVYSKDSNWNISKTYMDSTQIHMTIHGTGSPATLNIKYYIFETPLS
jgi:hypothetical protein